VIDVGTRGVDAESDRGEARDEQGVALGSVAGRACTVDLHCQSVERMQVGYVG
jgi:hypothetical protein